MGDVTFLFVCVFLLFYVRFSGLDWLDWSYFLRISFFSLYTTFSYKDTGTGHMISNVPIVVVDYLCTMPSKYIYIYRYHKYKCTRSNYKGKKFTQNYR